MQFASLRFVTQLVVFLSISSKSPSTTILYLVLFNSSFAEWVIKMANLGFPGLKAQIIEAEKLYLDKVNIKVKAFNYNRPEIFWFYGFLQCHP